MDANWKKKAKRFVLFFDILGFKELVTRNSHAHVNKTLEAIVKAVQRIPKDHQDFGILKNQTRSVTFSDSIIVFSCGCTKTDAMKILMDAHLVQYFAFTNNIPIKGAISYGDVTVDFENSVFFGQPIIDAYLLHEDLHLLSVIIDHHAERRFEYFKNSLVVYNNIFKYLTPMKYGKVNHKLLRLTNAAIDDGVEGLHGMYNSVSGKPRGYIDNTINLYEKIINDLAQQ